MEMTEVETGQQWKLGEIVLEEILQPKVPVASSAETSGSSVLKYESMETQKIEIDEQAIASLLKIFEVAFGKFNNSKCANLNLRR
jgi:hypothetical protein